MMKFFSKLFGGGIGTVGDTVKTVAGVFSENREAKAQRAASAQDRDVDLLISAQAQFAREFHRPRNFFDSLINGINRLPRPIMALGTIGMLGYAFYDPAGFTAAGSALGLIPQELWWLISAVVAFYFGARHFEKRAGSKVDLALARELLARNQAAPPKAGAQGADSLFDPEDK